MAKQRNNAMNHSVFQMTFRELADRVNIEYYGEAELKDELRNALSQSSGTMPQYAANANPASLRRVRARHRASKTCFAAACQMPRGKFVSE